MNKELQDLAWSVLPKEFKDEVKKIYNADDPWVCPEENEIFDYLFGEHNLATDADGAEILCVFRKRVQQMYAANERIKADFPDKETAHISDHINHVLKHLFGSKCLPDNVESSEPNVDSLPQNPTENCDNKSHISADCNKPAEPKFKVGDMAVVRGFKHPLLKSDGAIVTILSYHDKGDFYSCAIAPNVGIDIDAKYLEPYTEPTANNPKESANTFASDEPTDTKSDDFDRIVNDGFRGHNRLHIATQITASIYSNDKAASQFNSIEALVRKALDIADTLIAEVEKGAER